MAAWILSVLSLTALVASRAMAQGDCGSRNQNFSWPLYENLNQGNGNIPSNCTLAVNVSTQCVFPVADIDQFGNTYVSDSRGLYQITLNGTSSLWPPVDIFTCSAAGRYGCYVVRPTANICVILAFSWPAGAYLWSVSVNLSDFNCYPDNFYTQIQVVSDHVLLLFNTTTIILLDASNGASVGRMTIDSPPPPSSGQFIASNGRSVFVSSSNAIYAFDLQHGRLVWKLNNMPADRRRIFSATRGSLFAQSNKGATTDLLAIRADTGVTEWTDTNTTCAALLAVLHNCTLLCSGHGTAQPLLLALQPGAKPSPLPYTGALSAIVDRGSKAVMVLQPAGSGFTHVVAYDLLAQRELWAIKLSYSVVYLAMNGDRVVINAFVPDLFGSVYIVGVCEPTLLSP